MGKQHYMTHDERIKLETLLGEKKSVAYIAQKLGFSRQTIYNEIEVGTYTHTGEWRDYQRYSAQKADSIHQENQTAKGRPLKIGKDRAFADFLERKMLGIQENGKVDRRKRYSPAAALAEARKQGYTTNVCTTTLYSYIDKRIFYRLKNRDLWQKCKKKPPAEEPERRNTHPKWPCISDRPEYINSREEPGHVEMDLIMSCKKGKGALLTITERAGRTEIIRKVPDKKAATIRAALAEIKKKLPEIRSITTDNGPEFLEYDELQKVVQCPVYYCHSYSAWEKGTNENHNRMIRRWFPKGTDFSKISKREIQECQEWMNNYPRKKLGWLTPNEFASAVAA